MGSAARGFTALYSDHMVGADCLPPLPVGRTAVGGRRTAARGRTAVRLQSFHIIKSNITTHRCE